MNFHVGLLGSPLMAFAAELLASLLCERMSAPVRCPWIRGLKSEDPARELRRPRVIEGESSAVSTESQ